MPSGYTAKIYEGQEVSGKEFIIQCARAFGATIMMHDEPLNAPIPEEFKPDTSYYEKNLTRAKAELETFNNTDIISAAIEAEKAYQAALKRHNEALEERKAMQARYERTLAEVQLWIPPTPDHLGLKDFCIRQIGDSMDFDCNLSYYEDNPPKRETAEEWLEHQRQMALRDISYHTEQMAKEIERTNERNEWIKALRESLVHFK